MRAIEDGLDSPSLGVLAGACGTARARAVRNLIFDALDELSIPRPDPRSPGQIAEGTPYSRLPTDALRLGIVDGEDGVEVRVHVNDTDIAEAVSGMGMHPFDLFVPSNQLIASAEPRRVVVGRCSCGEPGCGSTEALITRVDGVVHWDWFSDVPLEHGVSFDAVQYDAEIERIGDDRSWRTTYCGCSAGRQGPGGPRITRW